MILLSFSSKEKNHLTTCNDVNNQENIMYPSDKQSNYYMYCRHSGNYKCVIFRREIKQGNFLSNTRFRTYTNTIGIILRCNWINFHIYLAISSLVSYWQQITCSYMIFWYWELKLLHCQEEERSSLLVSVNYLRLKYPRRKVLFLVLNVYCFRNASFHFENFNIMKS